MKLNPDCIRDILLSVEDACDYSRTMQYQKDTAIHRLQKYSHDEIIYHIKQCKLSGLILGVHDYDSGANIMISDLSPAGHALLANVRKDTIWNSTKSIAAKIGSKSLDALIQISSNVISDLIKAQFGSPLNPSSPNM